MQTMDRAPIFAPMPLGKTRRITPEGYLVCEGVRIARTGQMLYHESELSEPGAPIKGDADGVVRVNRSPDEAFHADTINSFNGKPITIEHPDSFITPASVKKHAVGIVMHARRGTGVDADCIVADLMVTDPVAIEYVNKALPELSAGYNAAYRQGKPGEATQHGIVANHVALVARGRAGPRIAIKDHDLRRPTIGLYQIGPMSIADSISSARAQTRQSEELVTRYRDAWARSKAPVWGNGL